MASGKPWLRTARHDKLLETRLRWDLQHIPVAGNAFCREAIEAVH